MFVACCVAVILLFLYVIIAIVGDDTWSPP